MVRHEGSWWTASAVEVTFKNPRVMGNILNTVEGIPDVVRCCMVVNNYANVEWISTSIAIVGVIVDQDISISTTKFSLEWGLPPDSCHHCVLIKFEVIAPAMFSRTLVCETGEYCRDISTKAGDLIAGLLSSHVDDIPNLSRLKM